MYTHWGPWQLDAGFVVRASLARWEALISVARMTATMCQPFTVPALTDFQAVALQPIRDSVLACLNSALS